jgi:chemotaxis signal transduction protein
MGLLNVRGTVQMVVDLGQILGFATCELTENSRLIFIERSAILGLLVDVEIGVRYLRAGETPADAPSMLLSSGSALLDDQVVTVLDGASLIAQVAEQLEAPVFP